jgi:cell wall-associated NlpC family hydrolase
MPYDIRSPHSRRRLRRRVLAGLAGLLTAAAWTATSAGPVDAAPRWSHIEGDHHSPAVAAASTAALGAFDTFSSSGTPGDFVAYVAARDAAADTVATEMRLDAGTVRGAWTKADLAHQEAVLAALTQLGAPYRAMRADPAAGFDCSGLTSWAWARAGVQIAHQSSAQISAARRVDEASAVAGDIVQYPGHVMLYLGVDRAIVHASNPVKDVELSFVPRSVRFGDPEG